MLICRTNAKLWMPCVEMQHPFTNAASWDQSFTATASADSQLWQLGLCPSPSPSPTPFLDLHMDFPTPFAAFHFCRLFSNLL